MPVKGFEPKVMKVGVLTAALQELTPREKRDRDPDSAIEDWLAFGRELGADYIQVSAAVHPSEADVPPEAMLDPVANTLDLRQPFDKARARRIEAAISTTGVGISDFAFFENLLHHDPAVRKKKHEFLLRIFDTAALLGIDAVCGFIGRNQQRSMDQNLRDFEEQFVPLLEAAKERGLTYRLEQCPMPGWTTGDNWHNNIGYAPATWIALHRICEKHGVGDHLRIHYDPSHAILMGQDTRSIFQYLKDEGYAFLIGGFHVKGQVIDPKGVTAWGYGGQTIPGLPQYGDQAPDFAHLDVSRLIHGVPEKQVAGEHGHLNAMTGPGAPRPYLRSRQKRVEPFRGQLLVDEPFRVAARPQRVPLSARCGGAARRCGVWDRSGSSLSSEDDRSIDYV